MARSASVPLRSWLLARRSNHGFGSNLSLSQGGLGRIEIAPTHLFGSGPGRFLLVVGDFGSPAETSSVAAPVAKSTMSLAHWFRSRGRLGGLVTSPPSEWVSRVRQVCPLIYADCRAVSPKSICGLRPHYENRVSPWAQIRRQTHGPQRLNCLGARLRKSSCSDFQP